MITFKYFNVLRVYENDNMININSGYIKNQKLLPKGVPLNNMQKFKIMPQKCQQCATTLKNKKKYYLGDIINFDTGFWTYEKICKNCNHSNILGSINE